MQYPVLPDPDDQAWQKAVDYHKELHIPLRFSVLSGEIVHHLRSSLDHIVWFFSTPEYRRDHPSAIEFPVLCEVPGKDELRRYERKIKGIDNPRIRALIEDMQPYKKKRPELRTIPFASSTIWTGSTQHRELVIVHSGANVVMPGIDESLTAKIVAYRNGESLPAADVRAVHTAIKNKGIVFRSSSVRPVGERTG